MFKNAKVRGFGASPAEYNEEDAPRGSTQLVVRSHVLSEVKKNPRRWVMGYQPPESKSKLYGEVLDCLALTPHLWPTRFCSTPATYTNKKGGQSKWRNDMRIEEVAKWHEDNKGLTPVDATTNGNVHAALKRLQDHEEISEFLNSGPHQAWVEAEYEDKATGLTVPIKGLIDIVPRREHPVYGECLGDLKTTRNASPRRFAKDCYEFSYHCQAALYLDLWNAATGEERSDFVHVVQESFPPYELRMPFLAHRFLDIGRATYTQVLGLYCKCLCSGKWPSYDPDGQVAFTVPEPWMESLDAIYGPLEDDEDEEDETDEMPDEAEEVTP